jgi:anti-sigma factor RsiW
MITCPQSERLLPLLCDGELDGPLRREVVSHVSSCVLCTRALASIERVQELLVQAIDEQVEAVDFSDFWNEVGGRLDEPTRPWALRLRLWREKWWLSRSPSAPVWAAILAVVLTPALLLSWVYWPKGFASTPPEAESLALASNNQAQIESLSTAATVFLWNEPASNATVIWVGDEGDGGMP